MGVVAGWGCEPYRRPTLGNFGIRALGPIRFKAPLESGVVIFWLIVVGVVAFSWGFAAGATHEQYKPLK